MFRKRLFLIPMLFLLIGCSRETPQPTPRPQHPLIEAYTSGLISRGSTVRVVFIADVIDSGRVGASVTPAPFEFSPKIKGTAVWRDRRTIEFRPSTPLDRGTRYDVKLNLKRLFDIGAGDEIFSFRLATVKPSMELSVEGLKTAGSSERYALTGLLKLSDEAAPEEVEPMVQGRLNGKELPIRWEHSSGRLHRFTVEEISRGERPGTLQLRFDGKSAGIDERGEREIRVPARGEFSVIGVRAVQEEGDLIEIRFSEPLNRSQSLAGLIQVDRRPDLTFSVEQNMVRAYSSEELRGDLAVTVQAGVRSSTGARLERAGLHNIRFEETKPSVRFLGKGVILPTAQGATLPIEAVNLSAVMVTAVRINADNVPQFLQVNELDGERELRRVGREVWKQVVPLTAAEDQGRRRYGLDLSPLVADYPGGLYRLTLTFRRPHVIFPCDDEPSHTKIDPALAEWDDEYESWEWGYDYGFDWGEFYNQRFNPCHPGFYYSFWDHDITVSQNVLISDIGLIAKRGGDSLLVVVTDLKTAKPLSGVPLKVYDYQRTLIASAKTRGDGSALVAPSRKPFLVIAEHDRQLGYLKLTDGAALSVSHFDVGGTEVQKGVKGFLYGERGVWRPGDPMFLTLILMGGSLPADHPATIELLDPRGRIAQTQVQTRPLNGFYTFKLTTSPDAPTGNWLARCSVGGAVFQKTLKVETVMPNRLDARLDFGKGELTAAPTTTRLTAAWLFGAKASFLKARVELRLTPTPTRFEKFPNFNFDNPLAAFDSETLPIFEGTLNEAGEAVFTTAVSDVAAPGKLNAVFNTRVFEPGGAFSSLRTALPMHVYNHYIGVAAPSTDASEPTLDISKSHRIDIVRVTPDGRAEGNGRVEVKLYKIKWRWWWEKSAEALADYIGARSFRPVQTATVQLQNGAGRWELKVGESEWGRYLVQVRDLNGRHASGQIVYLDEPGWGRGRQDAADGVAVLAFTADKPQYSLGEPVTLTIPTAAGGRGLVTLESGSRVLRAEWFEPKSPNHRFTFRTTPEMAPTVYAHVTYLQPHLQTANDLPIRLYGVIPINVVDAQTVLRPVIECDDALTPETPVNISVKEANGKAMTYTLAIVDQGLLDLTRFETPNPWKHFYSREALGVKTWDVYDWVIGAYGGKLERLLGIGGGEALELEGGYQANRFPPMVMFLGPYELKRSETKTHTLTLPMYVGAARVMVVAGSGKAFGAADKSVQVRKPLMLLATLPRVLGVQEETALPISVFAMDPAIRQVQVKISAQGAADLVGAGEQSITFAQPGDRLVTFNVRAGDMPGIAQFNIEAVSGNESARQSVDIEVRNPMRRVIETASALLQPGESWSPEITLPGQAGTNVVTAELSRIPPLDLQRRLDFLISYPHGCVEQVTSAVFPQLYLARLLDLADDKKQEIEKNVKAGVTRLNGYQLPDGGLAYWPGADEASEWGTNYAGAFLLEAQTAGYTMPAGLLENWLAFQQKAARAWQPSDEASQLIQADRLYTLAAAGAPDLASMNRLKESPALTAVSRWRLAAAYQLAGQRQAAQSLATGETAIPAYRELSRTFGSDLRDKALMLETLTLLDDARAFALVQEISATLASDEWLSTQSTAVALSAVARFAGVQKSAAPSACTLRIDGREIKINSPQALTQQQWAPRETTTFQAANTGRTPLYVRLLMEGLPAIGEESASANGLELDVAYRSTQNVPLQPTELRQGADLVALVTVRNTGLMDYHELALTHLVPSGWEIHNERPADDEQTPDNLNYQDIRDDRVYTYFDLRKGESKTFRLLLTAAYTGRYYLPPIEVEAMYDAAIYARTRGEWIQVLAANP